MVASPWQPRYESSAFHYFFSAKLDRNIEIAFYSFPFGTRLERNSVEEKRTSSLVVPMRAKGALWGSSIVMANCHCWVPKCRLLRHAGLATSQL